MGKAANKRSPGTENKAPLTEAPAPSVSDLEQAEAERAVIGAILLGMEGVMASVVAELSPDCFLFDTHRMLFDTALRVQRSGAQPDARTIIEEIRREGKVADSEIRWSYLAKMSQSTPAAVNVPLYVRRLRNFRDGRSIIRAAQKMVGDIEGRVGEPGGAVAEFIARASRFGRDAEGDGFDDYERDGLGLYSRHVENQPELGEALRTGFEDLDRELVGLVPGAHLMLGARSEGGKSTLALNIACNVARGGRTVAFFGLEMTRAENYCRILAAESGIETARIIERRFTPAEARRLLEAASAVAKMRLIVFEDVNRLEKIVAIAHQLKAAGRLDLVVVDHLHLVEAPGEGYERNEGVLKALRNLATELKCVMLTVAQFPNHTARNKPGERPDKYWLQGGGFMHQLPSHIVLLHSPDRAVPKVEAIVAKNRATGRSAVVPLHIKGETNRFQSYSNR